MEVSTSKTGKHGHAKCHFVAIAIFNGKKHEDIVPSSHNCDVSKNLSQLNFHLPWIKFFKFVYPFSVLQVPHVNRTDYQLIDISEDGFVWCFLIWFMKLFL